MKSKGILYKIVYTVCLVVVAILLITLTLNLLNRPTSTTYSTLYRMIELKNVKNIIVSEKEITFSDLDGAKYVIYRVVSDNVIDKLYSFAQPYTILEKRTNFIPMIILLLMVSLLAFVFSLKKPDFKKATSLENKTKKFIIKDKVDKDKKSMYSGFSRNVSLYTREEKKLINDMEMTKEEQAVEEPAPAKEVEAPTKQEKPMPQSPVQRNTRPLRESRPRIRSNSAEKISEHQMDALEKYREDLLLDLSEEDFKAAVDAFSYEEYLGNSDKNTVENKKTPSEAISEIDQQDKPRRKSNFSKPSGAANVGKLRERNKKQHTQEFNDEDSFYARQKRGEV